MLEKDQLAVWARMIQEGIDCVSTANNLKESTKQEMYFDRAMEHLKRLRSELLQAKHCAPVPVPSLVIEDSTHNPSTHPQHKEIIKFLIGYPEHWTTFGGRVLGISAASVPNVMRLSYQAAETVLNYIKAFHPREV
jgi:hypothetical protein